MQENRYIQLINFALTFPGLSWIAAWRWRTCSYCCRLFTAVHVTYDVRSVTWLCPAILWSSYLPDSSAHDDDKLLRVCQSLRWV